MAYRDQEDYGYEAPTAQPAPTGPFGAQKRIADYWKTATGRDATQAEYSQWGGDIDENYFRKISGAIDALDESKAYKTSQNQPAAALPDQGGTPAPAPAPAPAPTGGGGGGGGAGGGSASGQSAPVPQNTAALDAYVQQLIQQNNARDAETQKYRQGVLNTVGDITARNSAPVTADDPIIAAQSKAFRGEGERAMAAARKNAAERNYARRTTEGSQDAEIQQMFEDMGRNSGSYTANLMGAENNARANRLMQAGQLGAGIMSGEQTRNLQQQMGLLNTQADLEKSRGGNALGWAELWQRPQIAGISAGPGYLSANNQNQQFYDKLAWDQSTYGNDMDSALAQYLLRS